MHNPAHHVQPTVVRSEDGTQPGHTWQVLHQVATIQLLGFVFLL